MQDKTRAAQHRSVYKHTRGREQHSNAVLRRSSSIWTDSMKMPDVNILIHAHRDQFPHHKFYKHWLEALCSSQEPFALSPLVAVAFVRIVTNPAALQHPSSLLQAFAFIETILSAEQCHQPGLGKNHWKIVRQLCESSRSAGKSVADAQHAAVAMEHACTWITRDRDFQKFKSQGLRVEFLEP